jgi:hypothetical protein
VDKCSHAHGCRRRIGGGAMSEPPLDDPIATGEADVCVECENTHLPEDDCYSNEPDEMWDDFFED